MSHGLLIAGDFCPQNRLAPVLKSQSGAEIFGAALPLIQAARLSIVNLECPLTSASGGLAKIGPTLQADPAAAQVLVEAGFGLATLANNHIMDYGYDGARHTVNTLDAAGVHWFGSNEATDKAWIYENNGVKIGFVGMEMSYWYYKHRNLLQSQVEALRADGCQVIIGSMHGGTEYRQRHLRNQKDFAYAMIDYGVDIVIGHHPHVLQGIEVKDGRTICYSIGNFVFGGNAKIRAPYTAMFQFNLKFTDDGQYLGHQLNIIPALPSGEKEFNNYQPVLATGEDAAAVIKQIQYDTPFTLKPYVEGVGAMQDFVPAPAR